MTTPNDAGPKGRRRAPVWLKRLVPRRARIAQLAAVAAIGLCLLGAWTIVRDPFAATGVKPGQAVADAKEAQPSAAGGPADIEGEQTASKVDAGFVLWSLSDAGGGRLFGLGQGDCLGTACPVLVRSLDDGRTWVQMHMFSSADTSASRGATQPQVQPARALSEVVFVSPSTGYVFGGDLWVTRDGGRTFTHVDHPDGTVLDVVMRAGQPLVLTASGCIQGVCSGRLEVSRLSSDDSAEPTQTIAAVTPSSQIDSAHLVIGGSGLLVVAGDEPGSGDAPGAWRLAGGVLAPLDPGSACNGKALSAVAAASSGALVAVCDEAVSARTTSFTTVGSTDGGMTWQLRGSGDLALPTQGQTSLATSDGRHVVAVSGGPRTAPDATTRSSGDLPVRVSSDGGVTWSSPSLGKQTPPGGFDSLVSSPPGTMFAVSRRDATVWRSDDQGAHWSHRSVAGDGG